VGGHGLPVRAAPSARPSAVATGLATGWQPAHKAGELYAGRFQWLWNSASRAPRALVECLLPEVFIGRLFHPARLLISCGGRRAARGGQTAVVLLRSHGAAGGCRSRLGTADAANVRVELQGQTVT